MSELSEVSIAVADWGPTRNRVRGLVVGNPWFERFWLLVILVNCFLLASEDPTDKNCVETKCKVFKVADYILTILFVVEMVTKMVGLGWWARHDAYFRDHWNILDFFIVVAGTLAMLLEVVFSIQGPVLSGLRAFRLLRPLKAVQAFPALQLLIAAILGSLPQLLNVMVLYCTFVLVMGILAVELWSGALSHHCVNNVTGEFMEEGERTCVTDFVAFGGHMCPWNATCEHNPSWNPKEGKLSFDNIGVAALTIYVALTLEAWTETMYMTMDASVVPSWCTSALFWVTVILFGAFFILNLTIVIVTEAFEMKQSSMREELFRKIDKDGGGDLDKDEVRLLLDRLGYEFGSEEALDQVFNEMDLDGGGTVSLDEFLEYCQNNSAAIGRAISKKGGVKSLMSDVKRWWAENKHRFGLVKKDPPAEGAEEDGFPPWRRALREVVVDPDESKTPKAAKWFSGVVCAIIILNTVALALEGHDTRDTLEHTLEGINHMFTICFVLEFLIKLLGLGFYGYFIEHSSNLFDFCLVVVSVVEIFGAGSGVAALRSFRVLRVLRLTTAIPLLSRWLSIVISSVKAASILTTLIFLIVFIIALLGMQLFGGEFCGLDEGFNRTAEVERVRAALEGSPENGTVKCDGVPRSNYDTLSAALLTSFQILTGEDWNVVMYNGMIAMGDAVALYFVFYYTLGNYMLLNLFIAVLLSNRDLKAEADSMREKEEKEAAEREREKERKKLYKQISMKNLTENKSDHLLGPENAEGDEFDDEAPPEPPPPTSRRERFFDIALTPLRPYMERNYSMFLIPPDNFVRQILTRLIDSWAFEVVVILAICLSTVALAMESPRRPPDHPTENVLRTIDMAMLWVFLAEAVFKSIVLGFVLHKTSYLRSTGWNVLDFVIVCISVMSIILPGGGELSTLKLLRTMRPLRFINKFEGMRVVVRSLVKSAKPLLNVMFISFIVWLIFAIVGVKLFSGKFYQCRLNGEILDYVDNKTFCVNSTQCPRPDDDGTTPDGECLWVTFESNFDNTGKAFLTLFEMASLEGWVTVMEYGVDAVSHEEAPRLNHSPFVAYYFIIFIVFGSFFLMNLFIGVLIDTYYAEKERLSENGAQLYMTQEQKQWVEQHKVMLVLLRGNSDKEIEFQSLFGTSHNKKFLNLLVQSPKFEKFILGCVCLNVLLMTLNHYPESDWLAYVGTADLVFIGIFTLEATAKLCNYGWKWYFKEAWNRFDFAIVVLSLLGVILEVLLSGGAAVSAFRVIRLARLFRMAKWAEGIQVILKTLYLALPSMLNVAGIIGLMFFQYSVLGVKLFARLERLEPHVHFETFYVATLLLMRITTGEAWQTIMHAASASEARDECDPQLDTCGSKTASVIYFSTFTLASMYVLLNLFIAVIVDSFSMAGGDKECSPSYLERVDARFTQLQELNFVAEKCPDLGLDLPPGIPIQGFAGFLQDIGPPLGFPKFMPASQQREYLDALDIKPHALTGLVTRWEAYPKMFHKAFGRDLPDTIATQLQEAEEEVNPLPAQVRAEFQLRTISSVQRVMRGWLARKRVRDLQNQTPEGRPLRGRPPPLPASEPSQTSNPLLPGMDASRASLLSTDEGLTGTTGGSAKFHPHTQPKQSEISHPLLISPGFEPGPRPHGQGVTPDLLLPRPPAPASFGSEKNLLMRNRQESGGSGILAAAVASPQPSLKSKRRPPAPPGLEMSPSGSFGGEIRRSPPLPSNASPLLSQRSWSPLQAKKETFIQRPRRQQTQPTLTPRSPLGSVTPLSNRFASSMASPLLVTSLLSSKPTAAVVGCGVEMRGEVAGIVKDRGMEPAFCDALTDVPPVADVLVVTTKLLEDEGHRAAVADAVARGDKVVIGLLLGAGSMHVSVLDCFDKVCSLNSLGAALNGLAASPHASNGNGSSRFAASLDSL
eukprot:TRINITY_DN6673_c0_g2_i1.p1 TRINITY_DN6673_c0_g2~~TRINITY_DN6673_c0_g2_i1.p1  ORF type:complete len:1921 (+),score=676.65 TRINITY_DN6673_c0_g2_i1:54-5765(+)